MIQTIRNSSRLLMIAIMILLMAAGTGCKSKKKAMEAQAAADKARMEQEAAAKKQQEEDERKRKEAEELASREAESKKLAPAQKLDTYFGAIANAANVNSANSTINEALALFATPETPVLIIISQENGQKDYDRPTTIREYLNYLKDTKKSMNKIGDMKFDGSGKITELELVKQK
jgi:hypothetical protein